jgi:hypothetical protein
VTRSRAAKSYRDETGASSTMKFNDSQNTLDEIGTPGKQNRHTISSVMLIQWAMANRRSIQTSNKTKQKTGGHIWPIADNIQLILLPKLMARHNGYNQNVLVHLSNTICQNPFCEPEVRRHVDGVIEGVSGSPRSQPTSHNSPTLPSDNPASPDGFS